MEAVRGREAATVLVLACAQGNLDFSVLGSEVDPVKLLRLVIQLWPVSWLESMSDRETGRQGGGAAGRPWAQHQAVRTSWETTGVTETCSERHCSSWSLKSYFQTSVFLVWKGGVGGAGGGGGGIRKGSSPYYTTTDISTIPPSPALSREKARDEIKDGREKY